jgi:hypothetical protein
VKSETEPISDDEWLLRRIRVERFRLDKTPLISPDAFARRTKGRGSPNLREAARALRFGVRLRYNCRTPRAAAMLPSFIVTAPPFRTAEIPPSPSVASGEVADLIRQQNQILAEQSQMLRHLCLLNDSSPKWKQFLAKWQDEFADVGGDCKQTLTQIERTYLKLVSEVNERLRDADPDDLANDFALGEFLDRYSTRLAQLAGMMHQLNPLAENAIPLPALE